MDKIFVNISVYDILGRKVKELVNEEKPAGRYELKFDGSNLSSGVYFYSIKAGKHGKTNKFILLK
ncbi:MAG: T9SS type A sorting domain-containing protein [Ignavibacteriaceae bacterium]|nr:T9SS type A sorting domain-containing protein [Ignavibacteriaceae bacterium]